MPDFAILNRGNGIVYEDDEIAVGQLDGLGHLMPKDGTTFVAVAGAEVWTGDYAIGDGMYAALPDTARLLRSRAYNCRALAVSAKHYNGIFMLGGPLEPKGRLKYIDGCTDTMLIPPQRRGDPCLNALFFPPRINQTRHYHPSVRVGLVYDGEGVCHHDGRDTPLRPGDIFMIPKGGWHCFETTDSWMRIVAFHPDSLWGPDDDNHQMLDATLTA